MAFFTDTEIEALPFEQRIRAKAAISIACLSPGLTPEFVFVHGIQEPSACSEWLGQMVEYYEGIGEPDVAAPLAELRHSAIAIGI
jgi:hypothetical protein